MKTSEFPKKGPLIEKSPSINFSYTYILGKTVNIGPTKTGRGTGREQERNVVVGFEQTSEPPTTKDGQFRGTGRLVNPSWQCSC